MRSRIGRMLLLFGYIVVLVEVLQVAAAWWNGEIETFGIREALALAALPVLAWIWWRASIFGQRAPRCLVPNAEDTQRGSKDSA